MIVIIDMVNGDIARIGPRSDAERVDSARSPTPTQAELPELMPRLEIVPTTVSNRPVPPPPPPVEIQSPGEVH